MTLAKFPLYVVQAFVAGASVLVSVCAWFSTGMIEEMRGDVKAMYASIYQLRVEKAASDEILNGVRTRLEICEVTTQKLRDDFHGLEVRLSRGR